MKIVMNFDFFNFSQMANNIKSFKDSNHLNAFLGFLLNIYFFNYNVSMIKYLLGWI